VIGSGASSGKCSSLVRSTALDQMEEVLDLRRPCVPHQVSAAARHNHEISRRQLHCRHTFDFQPTRSVDDYVKNGALTRYTKAPRRVKLREKVQAPPADGSSEADRRIGLHARSLAWSLIHTLPATLPLWSPLRINLCPSL